MARRPVHGRAGICARKLRSITTEVGEDFPC